MKIFAAIGFAALLALFFFAASNGYAWTSAFLGFLICLCIEVVETTAYNDGLKDGEDL